MISGLFIGSNDGRPPQAYKENIVSLISRSDDIISHSDKLISRSDDKTSRSDDIITRSDDLISRSGDKSRFNDMIS